MKPRYVPADLNRKSIYQGRYKTQTAPIVTVNHVCWKNVILSVHNTVTGLSLQEQQQQPQSAALTDVFPPRVTASCAIEEE